MGAYLSSSLSAGEVGWGGRLLEAGRLKNFFRLLDRRLFEVGRLFKSIRYVCFQIENNIATLPHTLHKNGCNKISL